jgi:hypothetical protein
MFIRANKDIGAILSPEKVNAIFTGFLRQNPLTLIGQQLFGFYSWMKVRKCDVKKGIFTA